MPRLILDDFNDPSTWTGFSSGQAKLDILPGEGSQGKALCLNFDFQGGGGFVVARRLIKLRLPETYAFSMNIRGWGAANSFEFKLLDAGNENVWRYREAAFEWPRDWQPLRIPSRRIDFAWGPAGGGRLTEVAAIEVAIAAGPGGEGQLCIEALAFEDLTPTAAPVPTASSALPQHPPAAVLEPSTATSWRSRPGDPDPWLSIDFGVEREYGGLLIHWETDCPARAFQVQTSSDGLHWTTDYQAPRIAGPRNYVFLPGGASSWLRLLTTPALEDRGVGIRALTLLPFDVSRSLQVFFQHLARQEAKGCYPRYLWGEQSYWTPVGSVAGGGQGLLNEEGLFELDGGECSIEPFLWVEGHLQSWSEADITQGLEEDYLPIPSVLWRLAGLELEIAACALGPADQTHFQLGYRLRNSHINSKRLRLFLAIRPFQVTPPWQEFHHFGGVTPIRELAWRAEAVWVNQSRRIRPLDPPSGFGVAAFDQGEIVTGYLQQGELPSQTEVSDPFGQASGALVWELELAPGETKEVRLAIPFAQTEAAAMVHSPRPFAQAAAAWRSKLGAIEFYLPRTAQTAALACKTAAAHILINRDGPALQPGPRRYTRCWMRDGAIMAAALLRLGLTREAVDFLRWYARFQSTDGNIPCCLDGETPDWLPEHDSHGQFIYTAMECYRLGGDVELLRELWPAVQRAVDHIQKLRRQRLGTEYQTGELANRYGLLPESVSHEGYLAHPVHAYWDDFWALRGLKDAVTMARILGEASAAAVIAPWRDDLRPCLAASIRAVMEERRLDFLPASVEWADPDPVAMTIALTLVDEAQILPPEAVTRSFDLYLQHFRAMHQDQVPWSQYTPYEIRIIGALVRLGRRNEARELLEFFLSDRRPRPWNQWPEIAWRDYRTPGHLGDLPHAWIGAEYILAFLSLFLYEREADQALVIGAGIPEDWLDDPEGIEVKGLRCRYGRLDLSLRRTPEQDLQLELGGELGLPPGGIIFQPPGEKPLRAVLINDQPTRPFSPFAVRIGEFPAEVRLSYRCHSSIR